jgi:hypothetical protein
MQPYSMLTPAASASGQHVAATASSCRPVLLKPLLGNEATSEKNVHEVKGWSLGDQHPGCVPNQLLLHQQQFLLLQRSQALQ